MPANEMKRSGIEVALRKYTILYDLRRRRTFTTSQDFFSEAFNAREQSAVVNTLLENPDNITYGTESGNNTTDKVFLLSESEVWNTEKAKAFGLAENYYARIVRSSTYARAMGTYDGYWVLRTPGNTQKVVTYIWNNLVLDNMK